MYTILYAIHTNECIQHLRLSKEFEPQDKADQDDENHNNGDSSVALRVHSI